MICKEVLNCMLRMHALGRAQEAGIIATWRKDLDYLRSAIEASRSPANEEFAHNGMIPSSQGST